MGFYRACLFAGGWEIRYFLLCCASNLGIFKGLKSKFGYFLWFSKKKILMSIPITSTLGVSPPPPPPRIFCSVECPHPRPYSHAYDDLRSAFATKRFLPEVASFLHKKIELNDVFIFTNFVPPELTRN